MYRSLLLFFVGLGWAWSAQATDSPQRLLSYEKVASISKDSIASKIKSLKVPEWVMAVDYAVDIYEILYKSTYYNGEEIMASGLYFVPVGVKQPMPLLSYHHGTTLRKERQGVGFWGEQHFCMGFATDGYAVAYPDYFGLGKSEGKHLYCHAESEAQAVIDMLRAVREFNDQMALDMNGQLFLAGYSQGGHVTMSAHRKIQQELKNEFIITASAPLSGPYDMSGVQSTVMKEVYSDPAYLPYLLTSYDEVYGLYQDPKEVFVHPYDTLIHKYFTGEYELNEINHLFPSVPKDMVHKQLLEDYFNNPQSPLLRLTQQNDVYDWKPEAPMMLCYCDADEQVTYKNAHVAHKKMRENGSEMVVKRRAARKFGHTECSFYSVIYTKLWFDNFVAQERDCKKLPKTGRVGKSWQRFLLDLSKVMVKKGQLIQE